MSTLPMPAENAAVAVFDGSESVEAAMRKLVRAGFDTGNVSVAGRDDSGEGVTCYHQALEGVRYWGAGCGEFWNRMWKLLPGWAMLDLPGTGKVLLAGALAGWVVTTLENAAIFTGLTVFGATLYSIGIPRNAVPEYEAALATGKYLVVAHGPAGEIARAKRLLRGEGLGAAVKSRRA